MTTRRRRVTLQQVADRAGVSTPTISKVLNGRPDVAPATRELVLRVLNEEGYRPRGAAAISGGTRHIEMVVDSLESPNLLDLLSGVLEAAGERGDRVAISVLDPGVDPERWLADLKRAGRAGLVIVTVRLSAGHIRHLRADGLPFVLIDPVNLVDSRVVSVGTSNWQGGFTATSHLLDLGHRRIAMVRGLDCLVDDARFHGYAAALARHGLGHDPDLVRRGDFTYAGGLRSGAALLALPSPPTAVFAANDLEALGVIEAARTAGLRVPDDLSVVGFDDNVVARSASPPLTTVRQPLAEMGTFAYRGLADILDGKKVTSPRVELSAELVIRSSTARPSRT
ncbi:MAG: substrate-binding domain-containing protein [Tetrasphaera sp.]|jgi:LacI family transcriptional regulator|nr:substrate-binding domain-containing protein [Tetrasphaera sp.]